MQDQSPMKVDEVAFTKRLLFETLHFDEPIEKTAESIFQSLGLQNGAIENFQRVLGICQLEILAKVYQGQEPSAVCSCPWPDQIAFLARDAELSRWIRQSGNEPADIKPFTNR